MFGGETTVVVKGKGKGGRNQELVLSAGLELEEVSRFHHEWKLLLCVLLYHSLHVLHKVNFRIQASIAS